MSPSTPTSSEARRSKCGAVVFVIAPVELAMFSVFAGERIAMTRIFGSGSKLPAAAAPLLLLLLLLLSQAVSQSV